MKASAAQQALAWQIKVAGLPRPDLEVRFHPVRRWRFDLAWADRKVAIEIDGGGFVLGRHSRGKGMEADCEKYCEAMVLGWRVLRVTPRQVQTGQALKWIQQVLEAGI